MKIFSAISILTAALFVLGGCGSSEAPSGEGGAVELTINVGPTDKQLAFTRKMAQEYESQTGIPVEIQVGPNDATERLTQYYQYLGAKTDEIDIYMIDVIWPGLLGSHFLDLRPAFRGDLSEFFQPIIENNTAEGSLVGIPWFADAGILYYRTDLLEKYGYEAPPETWDELEAIASAIQEGERAAGNPDFWGFVWQGKAYEGLTCNGIEWLASHGGGHIVEPDGTISINNPEAVSALERAAGWVGTISPPGVPTYAEEEARVLWQNGNAAFMRNWPYAYAKGNEEGSAIARKFHITTIPSGGAGSAAALGGWQLGVSKYSSHPAEAIEFVRFLSTPENQKRRLIEAGVLPTREAVYGEPEVAEAVPYAPELKEVFENASPRPSTVTGENYNQVSTIFFKNVNDVLIGRQSAEDAVRTIESQLQRILP